MPKAPIYSATRPYEIAWYQVVIPSLMRAV